MKTRRVTMLQHTIVRELDLAVLVVRLSAWARENGAGEVEAAAVTTCGLELATNVLKYAHSGQLRALVVRQHRSYGLKLIVEDVGPGIPDIAQATQKRFSTGGSLGLGLSGAQRLMDDFQISPRAGKGTRICAVKWLSEAP